MKNPLIHLELDNLIDYFKKWSIYAESIPQSIKVIGIKNILKKYSKILLILIKALRSSNGVSLKFALLSLLIIKSIGLIYRILKCY